MLSATILAVLFNTTFVHVGSYFEMRSILELITFCLLRGIGFSALLILFRNFFILYPYNSLVLYINNRSSFFIMYNASLVFFVGMVTSYYLYSKFVAGFFSRSYAMIWVTFTVISPILAFICW